MDSPPPGDDNNQRLLLDALVSYADACVIPQLTPSCPFYLLGPTGPTCEEQCRTLQDELGGPDRPVSSIVVSGSLMMTGRVLPATTAAGSQPYDAGQRFVQERLRPPQEQSTASLLLGLRAALRVPVLGDTAAESDTALALWRELARRGVPVEAVIRGALLRDTAWTIAFRAAAPLLAEAGVVPSNSSTELRTILAETGRSGWTEVLRTVAASWDSPERMAADLDRTPPLPLPDLAVPPWEELDGPAPEALDRAKATPEIRLAFSGPFLWRVEEWLSRQLEDNLTGLLRAAEPPASVLLALPLPSGTVRDEVGLWTWERFTRSRTDEWSLSSLLLEWRAARGTPPPDACPPRVLAERTIESAEVADLALDRQSRRRGRPAAVRGLTATTLTASAVNHLKAGRWPTAAEVFTGLIALRPTDGDAWNNLGFCQLPTDPLGALQSLQQATLYEREDPVVNAANRALALHLTGRDADALTVAEAALASIAGQQQTPAIFWEHGDGCGQAQTLLEHENPESYVNALLAHIRMASPSTGT